MKIGMKTRHYHKVGHRKELPRCATCGKPIVGEAHDESQFKAERYYHPACCPACKERDADEDAWEWADIKYDESRNT